MPVTVIAGAQWGDEAKGKVTDLMAENAEIVARFNGGDNAGHTVINEYGTFKLRLIPNGFSNPSATCVIGPGVVVNLATLAEEIQLIQSRGIDLSERLWVSPRCHVIMPYHSMLETIYENAKGEGRTGTTKRGIGPVYADKVSYNGIRLFDLQNKAIFSEKLNVQLSVKNPILEAFGFKALEASAILREKFEQYEAIQPFVREPFGLMQTTLAQGANVLLEGAQAALLDTDWGTYPFSTASTTLSGGANAGLGIAPHWISRVIGVAKAYTTRVGGGPMPSELFDSTGQMLIQEGGEYGTVTGRPRRCGWFDAELVRFTAQLNGFDEVVLTKLDVLDKLPKIKICIGYRNSDKGSGKGQTEKAFFHYWEGDASWLEQCEPVYTELDGWRQSTKAVREFHRLPKEAQVYIRKIEELISVPVHLVSVGPARDEIITVPPLH